MDSTKYDGASKRHHHKATNAFHKAQWNRIGNVCLTTGNNEQKKRIRKVEFFQPSYYMVGLMSSFFFYNCS